MLKVLMILLSMSILSFAVTGCFQNVSEEEASSVLPNEALSCEKNSEIFDQFEQIQSQALPFFRNVDQEQTLLDGDTVGLRTIEDGITHEKYLVIKQFRSHLQDMGKGQEPMLFTTRMNIKVKFKVRACVDTERSDCAEYPYTLSYLPVLASIVSVEPWENVKFHDDASALTQKYKCNPAILHVPFRITKPYNVELIEFKNK